MRSRTFLVRSPLIINKEYALRSSLVYDRVLFWRSIRWRDGEDKWAESRPDKSCWELSTSFSTSPKKRTGTCIRMYSKSIQVQKTIPNRRFENDRLDIE